MRTSGGNFLQTSHNLHNIDIVVIKKRNGKRLPNRPWKFYSCKECSYRTTLHFMINVHRKKHKAHHDSKIFDCAKSTLEKYKCSICSREYATLQQALLKRHMRIFHEIQLGRRYENENNQNNNCINQYNCKNCDFITYSQLLYITHYSKCSVKCGAVSKNIECWKCSKCCYNANTEKLLDDHKRRQHPVCVYKEQNSVTEPVGSMVRLCDWCDFFTTNKNTLRKHMLDQHNIRGEDYAIMYACKECPFESNFQAELYNHVKTHVSEEFRCEYCPFYSNQKRLLDVHIATYSHFDSKRTSDVEITQNDVSFLKSKEPVLRQADNELEYRQTEELPISEELAMSSGSSDFEENLPLSIISKIQNSKASEFDQMYECELCSSQYALRIHLINHILHKHPASAEQIYFKYPECRFHASTDEHGRSNNENEVSERVKGSKEKKSSLCSKEKQLEAHATLDSDANISSNVKILENLVLKKSSPKTTDKSEETRECIKCPECNFRSTSVKLLKAHIARKHEIVFIEKPPHITSDIEMMENDSETKSSLNTTDKKDELILRRSDKITDKKILVQGEKDKEISSLDSLERLSTSSSSSDPAKKHPLSAFPNSKDLKISKSDKMYKCELCPARHVLKENLMKHVFHEHRKTPKQMLQCSKCSFQTTKVQSLKVQVSREREKTILGCCTNSIQEKKKQITKHNTEQTYTDLQPRVILERLKMQPPIITKEVEKSRINNNQPRVVLERLKIQPSVIKQREEDRMKNDQRLKQAIDNEKQKWLTCELCSFKSVECSKLKWHILTAHVAVEPVICFKCQLCSFPTTEDKTLQKHILEVHIDPQCYE